MFNRILIAFLFLASVNARAQVVVTGTVIDPSGAAVAGANVSVRGTTNVSAVADNLGNFRIEALTPGRYRMDVKAGDAFKPLRRDVIVSPAMAPLVIQLSLAAVEESLDVTADDARPSVDTAANLDTTTVSGAALDQLPVFDQDFVGALSQFLDPASIATGGATIIVDGVEMKSAGVPKSAVQEISINDDPYSAESSRPGRGRIEIITKPGSGHLRGNVNFTFRNAALATRSYFAPVKPPEQRQAAEGVLSGPIGKEGTSFLMTFSRQNDDAAAVVHALTPDGAFDQTVAAPSTNTEFMARVTHDWNEKHRGSLQVNWKRSANQMQGVGGVVLPQAAVNASSREDDLFFTVHSILTPERLNQFQLTVELNREPSTSISTLPGIIVRDAFTSGGAQSTILRTESGGKLNDFVTISHGKHIVKFGVQIPNLNRRVWDDETNRGGTFSFATLADYAASRPYAYTVQRGSGRVSLWWREYGAFVQDQVRLSPKLQASFGLRYDWQAFFHDANNFSPRASLAWSPANDGKTIIRGGAGLFYDRTGVGPVASLMLHNGTTLRSYTILNPSYPDPFAGGVSLANVPTNVTQLASDVQIPYTLQYSVGVERQLAKSLSFVAGYRASRGHHLFRSVDVNAPLPPAYSSVPVPSLGHVQQIRSDGRLRSDALELTLRGRAGKRLSGQAQYTLSRASNDTGGIFWYPSNQYAPVSAEWGPADFDVRHRLNLLGTLSAGRWGNFGLSGRFTSALPYSETAGTDPFHTGMANARPTGVGRNTLRGSGYRNVDLRWSHDVRLTEAKGEKGRELTLSVDAFNILNHPNFTGYVGNVRSPFYLSPTSVSPGRRLQLSAEVKFGG
jgi:outer membrane receptor protein involved in Fe transport